MSPAWQPRWRPRRGISPAPCAVATAGSLCAWPRGYARRSGVRGAWGGGGRDWLLLSGPERGVVAALGRRYDGAEYHPAALSWQFTRGKDELTLTAHQLLAVLAL